MELPTLGDGNSQSDGLPSIGGNSQSDGLPTIGGNSQPRGSSNTKSGDLPLMNLRTSERPQFQPGDQIMIVLGNLMDTFQVKEIVNSQVNVFNPNDPETIYTLIPDPVHHYKVKGSDKTYVFIPMQNPEPFLLSPMSFP